jgi:hypothetical protein
VELVKFKYHIAGYGWAFLDIELAGFKPDFNYADAFCEGLSGLLNKFSWY